MADGTWRFFGKSINPAIFKYKTKKNTVAFNENIQPSIQPQTIETHQSMRKFTLLLALLLFTGMQLLAQRTITGKVISADDGLGVPGVSVVVKGTTVGTLTNIYGNYKLSAPGNVAILVFSYIGMKTVEVPVSASNIIDVKMENAAKDIEGIVVIGYGTQKKSVVTGAISSVKGGDLNNMQVPRVEQALQGRTSGLTIASSSGQPGAGSTVRVRGTTSINDSDPLYVVDGVPVDNGGIDYLNSADIESIEVLKDAASAAIYGARAASGVILVTTKKGSAGRMNVNYSAYFGTQAPAKKLDLLNATQYATLRNEAAINGGATTVPFPNPESYGVGTDWQSTIFNNNAKIQNHELSVSGGNDKSTYYSSFGYFDQQGIVASEISNYNRLNIRFNSNHKVNKWLVFGQNTAYSHIKSKGSLNTNSEYGGPLASAINLDPITPEVITDTAVANASPYNNHPVVVDAQGRPYGISRYVGQEMTNPLAYIQTRLGNYGWSDNFVGDVYAEVEPVKGLKLKSDLGSKLAFYGSESFSPVVYLNASTSTAKNSFYKDNNKSFRWNFENTASYTRSFGLHNLTALLGISAFVENSKGTGVTVQDLPVNTFAEASMNFPTVPAQWIAYGWESADHKVSSLFGRLTYNYKEKYLFTGIIRRDGSSRFGSNNKYGVFPSASIGWVTSREEFWPVNNVVNLLKIRGSYGVTGNDNIGDFRYLSTIGGGRNYTFGNDNYTIGYSPDALSNPDLKWEQTSQSNIGFEATLLQYFSVVFDLYKKNTTGMLRPFVLPAYVGVGPPIGNVASMTNKGVEIELGFHKTIGEVDLKVNGNASYLKNEITDLGSVKYTTGASFQSSDYELTRNAVGQSIGSFYGFETLGVFHKQSDILGYTHKDSLGVSSMIQPNAQLGDFKFADLNGDGKITAADRTFIGDPTPTWSYGFSVSANYKGFDIMVFGQGVSGNKIFNGLRRLDMTTANWTTAALDRWTTANPLSDFPRISTSDPNKNFSSPSSFYLEDGSYLRIKTLQIGYNLPKVFLNKIGLQQFRIYVSSNNLLTFTKYKGYDPEIGGSSYGIDRGIYPQARSFIGGVNVTF